MLTKQKCSGQHGGTVASVAAPHDNIIIKDIIFAVSYILQTDTHLYWEIELTSK